MGNYAMSALGVLPLVPGAAALRAARGTASPLEGAMDMSTDATTNQVVNQPLYYHGTNNYFDTFDQNKLGSSSGAKDARLGFYHSATPRTAKAYVDTDNYLLQDAAYILTDAYKTDPNFVEDALEFNRGAAAEVVKRLASGVPLSDIKYTGKITIPHGRVMRNKIKTDNYKTIDMSGNPWDEDAQYFLAKDAKDSGYDGVIFKNMQDSGWFGGSGSDDVVLSFHAENIHPATE
jgi:hypothetical protein